MAKCPEIRICVSPLLFSAMPADPDSIVVVIDLIRFTTSLTAAFDAGVQRILPLTDAEEALSYRHSGFLIAGERDSHMIPGFDLGNSPADFLNYTLKGKSLVMTTTNGTTAIKVAATAPLLVMASLHNIDAVCVYLSGQQRPITFLCSGWKGEVSCEDVLLAGKALRQLSETGAFTMQQDACFMAMEMCQVAGNNWLDFILRNSPRLASKYSWLANDIAFCLSSRTSVSIPVLKGEWIEAL